jgi:hypothetical protein
MNAKPFPMVVTSGLLNAPPTCHIVGFHRANNSGAGWEQKTAFPEKWNSGLGGKAPLLR